MVLITIVIGAYKPTYLSWGPHIVVLYPSLSHITRWWLSPTPLKNMSSSNGMMTFPIDGQIQMLQITNQTNIAHMLHVGNIYQHLP